MTANGDFPVWPLLARVLPFVKGNKLQSKSINGLKSAPVYHPGGCNLAVDHRQTRAPALRLVPSVAVASLFLAAFAFVTAPSSADEQAYTNRLIDSNNPYLLHAHNPVDWYPWGAEALTNAPSATTNRSSCRSATARATGVTWPSGRCFRIPRSPELMNEWFVNIKVDREERPDVDAVYLLATQLITGGAGGLAEQRVPHARFRAVLRRRLLSARGRRRGPAWISLRADGDSRRVGAEPRARQSAGRT